MVEIVARGAVGMCVDSLFLATLNIGFPIYSLSGGNVADRPTF